MFNFKVSEWNIIKNLVKALFVLQANTLLFVFVFLS